MTVEHWTWVAGFCAGAALNMLGVVRIEFAWPWGRK